MVIRVMGSVEVYDRGRQCWRIPLIAKDWNAMNGAQICGSGLVAKGRDAIVVPVVDALENCAEGGPVAKADAFGDP